MIVGPEGDLNPDQLKDAETTFKQLAEDPDPSLNQAFGGVVYEILGSPKIEPKRIPDKGLTVKGATAALTFLNAHPELLEGREQDGKDLVNFLTEQQVIAQNRTRPLNEVLKGTITVGIDIGRRVIHEVGQDLLAPIRVPMGRGLITKTDTFADYAMKSVPLLGTLIGGSLSHYSITELVVFSSIQYFLQGVVLNHPKGAERIGDRIFGAPPNRSNNLDS